MVEKLVIPELNAMVEKLVIPELNARNDTRAIKWLTDRTNTFFFGLKLIPLFQIRYMYYVYYIYCLPVFTFPTCYKYLLIISIHKRMNKSSILVSKQIVGRRRKGIVCSYIYQPRTLHANKIPLSFSWSKFCQ